MSFALTREGLSFRGRTIAWLDCITYRHYNRPEKRIVPGKPDKADIFALTDSMAEIRFQDTVRGLILKLRFERSGNDLSVNCDTGSAVETDGNKWRLMEISLLPTLLETRVAEPGHYLLPCYCGTLVDFRERAPQTSRSRFYMDQAEWEKFTLLNCFGAITPSGSTLAIADSGEFHAWNDTEYNQNGKNESYASFGVRHDFAEVLPQEEKRVLYRFFPEAKNFAPLAFAYREYLMKRLHVVPLRERLKTNPVLEHVTHSMFIKIFLGQKMPFRPDGSGDYVDCATFEEAEKILDELQKAGIRKALINIVGWNNEGHDGTYPTRFPVNQAAGGEEGLRKLIRKALEMGYSITPHDNVTDVYQPASSFDYEYVSRDESGLPQSAGLWAGGTSFKACPCVCLDRWGGDFQRIYDLGFRGCYYLDAQATGLFRCTHPDHPADEKQFALSLARILEYPRSLYGAIACETPQAYTLPHTDMAAHMHGKDVFENQKKRLPEAFVKLVDRIIPFLNVAAHGLITFQVGKVPEALALCARTSMELSWRALANGADFRTTIPAMRESYQVHFEIAPEIQEAFVTEYAEDPDGTVRIAYDSGHRVTVCGEKAKIEKDGKLLWQRTR